MEMMIIGGVVVVVAMIVLPIFTYAAGYRRGFTDAYNHRLVE